MTINMSRKSGNPLILSSLFFSLLFFLSLKTLAALTGQAESSEVHLHISLAQEIRRNCLWVLSQRRLCHHGLWPLASASCEGMHVRGSGSRGPPSYLLLESRP